MNNLCEWCGERPGITNADTGSDEPGDWVCGKCKEKQEIANEEERRYWAWEEFTRNKINELEREKAQAKERGDSYTYGKRHSEIEYYYDRLNEIIKWIQYGDDDE